MMEAHVTTSKLPAEQAKPVELKVASGDTKPDAPEEDGFILRINGKDYDATDLTLNEAEEIEDLCGGIEMALLDIARPKTLRAIVYVLLKRDDPTITLEEAGKLKMRGILGANEE